MAKTAAATGVKGTYGTMYYVKDMASAIRFYKEKLGLKPAYESPDWTEFPLQGHSLCLHPAPKDGKHPKNGVLILHVDGIRQLVSELRDKGVKAGDPHEVHPGAWAADVNDPEGGLLSLYEGPKSS